MLKATHKFFIVSAMIVLLIFPFVQESRAAIEKEVNSKRCERLKGRLEERRTNLSSKEKQNLSDFEEVSTSLDTLISQYEAKYNVNALKTDKNVLDGMKKDFVEKYSILVNMIFSAETIACNSNDKSMFQDKLLEVNTAVISFKDKSREIVQFIKSVIMRDIRNLRKQILI